MGVSMQNCEFFGNLVTECYTIQHTDCAVYRHGCVMVRSVTPPTYSKEEKMPVRIIIGLITLLAVVAGLAPDAIPSGIVALALVILGLAYAAVAVDAEDATAYLVVTLAVGGAASYGCVEPHPLGWLLPGRHGRSGNYSSVCRCYHRTRSEDRKTPQGLKL